jgi:membrane fusion protein (multidrug efflux system)
MDPVTESPAHSAFLPPPAAEAAAPVKPARGLVKPLVIGGIAVAALAWIAQTAVHAYRYVETDNAYLTGHVHQISPQLEDKVQAVLVTDNQTVKAGDVLVRLDPLEFELAVQKSRASLDQAKAQENETRAVAAQADAQITEAEARIKQAGAQVAQTAAQFNLADLTLKRDEMLYGKGGVISQSDLDNARSAYTAAEAAGAANQANVAAAESALGSTQAAQRSAHAQIAAAAANVAVAESAVRDAERKLGYATITAPADGRVGNKSVEPGNYVLPGQILLSLIEPDPWIVANFKETQLPRMKVGQPVEITVDALPGQVLEGHIDSLAPASGAQFALLPPDNATGNFNKVVQRVPVKIVLDAASLARLGNRLRFGYSVVVSVRVR